MTANALGGEGSWEVSLMSSLQGLSTRTVSGTNEQHQTPPASQKQPNSSLQFKELKGLGKYITERGEGQSLPPHPALPSFLVKWLL